MVTDVFLCEDAHAQERSLLPEMLETVQANDLWIADRNFCTRAALMGIAQRQAYFVIRVHRNLPWEALEPLQPAGSSATGEIFEQRVTITYEGTSLTLRRIVVKLWVPTRHGDSEVAIFTNLPVAVATAAKVAELYRDRWSVEKLFQIITDVFSCELNTLGYPRAALFVFCVALVAFNIIESFADTLKQWAAKVDLKRFSSSPRGSKKLPKKNKFDPRHPHVSTARILNQT